MCLRMKLDEYLKTNEMTMQTFAAEVGVHVSTVHRVKYAKIMPSRKLVEAIFKATDGQVRPADLIEITGE